MKLSRPWLLPFVPFYYLGSLFVKKFYDWGIFKSTTYDIPIITVGNISVGGTGKSPFVDYLLKHFSSTYKLATLSRGYGRKLKGFQMLTSSSKAYEVGDEPLQFKINYPQITVAVDADRRNGIKQLKEISPELQGIILDDAFQHRKVKAGLQIVLTPYYKLYVDDLSLPAGDLREPKSAVKRADIIMVTKCPLTLSDKEKNTIKQRLELESYQKLYFTGIAYEDAVNGVEEIQLKTFIEESFHLITGIANPIPLIDFLKEKQAQFQHHHFKDHHNFTAEEIQGFSKMNKILTTEKDFMRLKDIEILKGKLFYIPIEIKFLNDENQFLQQIDLFLDH